MGLEVVGKRIKKLKKKKSPRYYSKFVISVPLLRLL